MPPRTTAIGALAYYVSHANPRDYQPTNITFGIMEPPPGAIRDKAKRKLAISERALADLARVEAARRRCERVRRAQVRDRLSGLATVTDEAAAAGLSRRTCG